MMRTEGHDDVAPSCAVMAWVVRRLHATRPALARGRRIRGRPATGGRTHLAVLLALAAVLAAPSVAAAPPRAPVRDEDARDEDARDEDARDADAGELATSDATTHTPAPPRPRHEPPADLLAEPAQVSFAPGATLGHEHATIRLRNRSDFARDVESIRISGSDWMGFEIVGDVLPDRIARGADTTIRVRARPNHFVEDAGDRFAAENYRRLREGVASLDVVVDGRSLRVPLYFQPSPRRSLSPAAIASVLAGLLSFVALAFGMVALAPTDGRARDAAPAWRGRPTAIELAALLVLALLPFAPAALDVAAHDPISLARAQAGLGGTRVHLDPTGLGVALMVGAWTWICVYLARAGAWPATRAPSPTGRRRRHDGLRSPALLTWIALVLTSVAVGTLAASADLGRIVLAQADVLPLGIAALFPTSPGADATVGAQVPAWFALRAPWLGAMSLVAMVLMCRATDQATSPPRHEAPKGADVTTARAPAVTPLSERSRALVDLAAGATFATLVWGGPLPVLGTTPTTTPTTTLVWGVSLLFLKTLVLVGGARVLLRSGAARPGRR